MRPLEILSLALLLVTIIFLFFRKERTFFLIMLFSTIGTTIAQYFIEGFRWQLNLYIYLLPTVYLCHPIQKENLHFGIKFFIVIWYALAVIIPYSIPIFSLPKPKGESFVGTETFHWVDSSRQEWFTEENVNDFREIMVQFWYPSADNQNKEVEPYMDFIELRSKTIAEAGVQPQLIPEEGEIL